MRKTILCLSLLVGLAACSEEPSGPADSGTDLFAEASDLALTADQRASIDRRQPRRCRSFRLTEAQRAEISALFAVFEQAEAADLATIRTALESARAAHRNGASREEIRGILGTAQPAMDRVRAAKIQLSVAVLGVLSPAQVASGCYTPHLRRA